MKHKFLVLTIGLMPALVVAQVDVTQTTTYKTYDVDGGTITSTRTVEKVDGVPVVGAVVLYGDDVGSVSDFSAGNGCGIPNCRVMLDSYPGVQQAEQQAKQQAKMQAAMRAVEDKQMRGPGGVPPMPDATMASPVPPVSSSVNSQMPASYQGQSVPEQQSVGLPPPTIRAEMPGQAAPSMPRVEPQVQNRSPAVNLAPNR